MSYIGTLVFKNKDDVKKSVTIKCDYENISDIILWYISHHSGDNIAVSFNMRMYNV